MIDDKELLELAKQSIPEEPSKKVLDRDVEQFIYDTGMKEDPNKYIPLKNIHWTYVKWCEFRGLSPLNINYFGREIKKRFKHIKGAIANCYFINKEPFQIDDEEIWNMRAYYRKVKEYGKKKTNKRKTSRIKESV